MLVVSSQTIALLCMHSNYQSENKLRKCKGLDFKVFKLKWMVLSQEKLKSVGAVLELQDNYHSLFGPNVHQLLG